ncbi:hypothetical protein BHM03_00010509 [Ensete ventricosum]|nr:hypothetical protein BHM03_00010509 [Ensete ventricosum]
MLSEAHPNLSCFITVAFPRTCRPGSPSRATAKARRCNHGAELCKKKSVEPLTLLHLPKGLLPLEGMEEVGYNRATGFVWLKQRKATNHVFKTIEKAVSYAAEVTAFVEDRRMSRMTGYRTQGASDDESCDNRRSPRPFPSSSAAFSAFVFFRRRRPRRLSMGARYPIMPGKAEVAKRCKVARRVEGKAAWPFEWSNEGGTEAEDGFHELQRWRRDNDYLLLDASSRVF